MGVATLERRPSSYAPSADHWSASQWRGIGDGAFGCSSGKVISDSCSVFAFGSVRLRLVILRQARDDLAHLA